MAVARGGGFEDIWARSSASARRDRGDPFDQKAATQRRTRPRQSVEASSVSQGENKLDESLEHAIVELNFLATASDQNQLLTEKVGEGGLRT